jgi:hypothetical protein
MNAKNSRSGNYMANSNDTDSKKEWGKYFADQGYDGLLMGILRVAIEDLESKDKQLAEETEQWFRRERLPRNIIESFGGHYGRFANKIFSLTGKEPL